MEGRPRDGAVTKPSERASPAERQALSGKGASREWVRISPKVSWYGKILIVGALLVTYGWELFHFIITLMTLD